MGFFSKLKERINDNFRQGRHRMVLGIPGEGIKYPGIYDFSEYEMRRCYYEFLLIRYWFKNKNSDGLFVFEPINIRKNYTNPFYIDAIKYDTSLRSECSLNCFVSIASDDKLFLRPHCEEDMPFIEAPSFRTEELMWLVCRLNELIGPSIWFNRKG